MLRTFAEETDTLNIREDDSSVAMLVLACMKHKGPGQFGLSARWVRTARCGEIRTNRRRARRLACAKAMIITAALASTIPRRAGPARKLNEGLALCQTRSNRAYSCEERGGRVKTSVGLVQMCSSCGEEME